MELGNLVWFSSGEHPFRLHVLVLSRAAAVLVIESRDDERNEF